MFKTAFMIRLLVILVPGLIIPGCSGGGEDPDGKVPPEDPASHPYYLSFRFNGEEIIYKSHTVAQFYYDEENLAYHCNLVASLETNNIKNGVTVFLTNKEAFVSGVDYQLVNGIEMAANGAVMPQVTVVLFDEDGKAYTAQFLSVEGLEFGDTATLRFTEITNAYVKGTFSAIVFTAIAREEGVITDGEFYFSIL